MDFLYQFIWDWLHHFSQVLFMKCSKFFFLFQKFAGLWLVGKVDNYVAIYGSKVAEGFLAFQRRLVLKCSCFDDNILIIVWNSDIVKKFKQLNIVNREALL